MANHDSEPPPRDSNQRGMIARDELPFLPKVRWAVWIPVLSLLLLAGLVYFQVEAHRARQQRAQLLAEHGVLTAQLAPDYRAVRAKVERLTFAAAAPWQGAFTAPGFDMRELQREPVLYGRVRIGEIHKLDDVAPSIRHRYPDDLASCLGIETQPVERYYAKGDFLMPAYVDSVRGIESSNRLVALRQDLEFRLRRDTPDLIQWSRRRYFVLAMDEGPSSIDGPTRVYIWDLRDERPVFRSRSTGGEAMVIPVRIAGMPGGGAPVPAAAGSHFSLPEHDCAVANDARQLLGAPVMTMQNVAHSDEPQPAAAADASAGGTASANPGATADGH